MATADSTPSRSRIQKVTPIDVRFWRWVHVLPTRCWMWHGFRSKEGYGRIKGGRRGTPVQYAHRLSYQMHVGAIPDGYEVDHLCRNRWCVNPDHLEPVPHQVNAIRGHAPMVLIHHSGRCSRGHEVTPENVYYRKDRPGRWNCLACRREKRAAVRAN